VASGLGAGNRWLSNRMVNGSRERSADSVAPATLTDSLIGARCRVLVVMGVAGSGKTTIAKALAARLGWRFIEGDDFHTERNLEKLRAGAALTDDDRRPWLDRLAELISDCLIAGQSCIVACSSLRREYRQILSAGREAVRFVFLRASLALLEARLRGRVGHFVDARILPSQLATLEEPNDALIVDASLPVAAIVSVAIDALELDGDDRSRGAHDRVL
jgi:gluconokinase